MDVRFDDAASGFFLRKIGNNAAGSASLAHSAHPELTSTLQVASPTTSIILGGRNELKEKKESEQKQKSATLDKNGAFSPEMTSKKAQIEDDLRTDR